MQDANKKYLILLFLAVSFVLLPGCTNWKKKYQALEVEHQNLKGLLDRERSEKGQLASQVSQDRQTIEELQKQIAERQKSPAEAT
ncbi:MAG: hypothetical protein ACYSUJ_10335, partial [Planctomycetota bacterium]